MAKRHLHFSFPFQQYSSVAYYLFHNNNSWTSESMADGKMDVAYYWSSFYSITRSRPARVSWIKVAVVYRPFLFDSIHAWINRGTRVGWNEKRKKKTWRENPILVLLLEQIETGALGIDRLHNIAGIFNTWFPLLAPVARSFIIGWRPCVNKQLEWAISNALSRISMFSIQYSIDNQVRLVDYIVIKELLGDGYRLFYSCQPFIWFSPSSIQLPLL